MMKVFFITMTISLLLLTMAVSAQVPDTDWYNTTSANFTISNADQLAGLAQLVNNGNNFSGKNITLDDDIDLSSYNNWLPIGNYHSDSDREITNPFSGTFNGGGYTISKLIINRSQADYQGLFGIIVRGKVENLGLDSVNINGGNFVGSVAGVVCSSSSVVNSYSTGSVIGGHSVGGIAGVVFNNSSVTSSYSTGTIGGIRSSVVGGVAGFVSDSSTVTSSYSTGDIGGDSSHTIGGVVGIVSKNSNVIGSYSTGTVSGIGSTVGGVAGDVSNNSSVVNSYSTGTVSGLLSSVGGVAGSVNNNSNVTNSYSAGAINGRSYVGGVAGSVVYFSNINNSYSTGTVSGSWCVGGIAGAVSHSLVTYCYSTGSVSGESDVGGIAGIVANGNVFNCAALNLEVKGDSLVGRVAGRTISAAIGEYPLGNNVAYIGMKNSNGDSAWDNIDGYDLNGANITINEINADETIGGRFTANNGWFVENGNLPGLLGKSTPMPVHLTGASFIKPSFIRPKTVSAHYIKIKNRTFHLRLSERSNVYIYSLNGAKLRSYDLIGGDHTISAGNLPTGIYIVKVTGGSRKQSLRIVVK